MLIAGLQKMSLVDFPGRVACTVFTGGCNLRCPFCHNSELLEKPAPAMEAGDVLAFLEKRKGLLDGVCVTGGEPCLQKDLPEFLASVRTAGFAVKLDTNGCYPEVLERILKEKLADYVAVDVKNSPELCAQTAGVKAFPLEAYTKSLLLLLESDTEFELRTTCVAQLHTEASFEGIRDFLLPLAERAGRKIPAYYLQGFVDRDTVPFAGFTAPSAEALRSFARILEGIAGKVSIRSEG